MDPSAGDTLAEALVNWLMVSNGTVFGVPHLVCNAVPAVSISPPYIGALGNSNQAVHTI